MTASHIPDCYIHLLIQNFKVSGMIIIFKKISVKTKKQDIKDFIAPVIKGSWLRKSGQIESIVILTQRNIRTRIIQYHVLIEIIPDSVAKRVIKKLNMKTLTGNYVAVCEYKVRNWHNDPRINYRPHKSLKNKRIADRRDRYEEVISEDINISGEQIFHTKGWE
jgi:hypothetical protein